MRKVAQNYPGRASSSPTIDVFITLMQMGTTGYKELMDERKENYKILKAEMTKIAQKYGERVLETKNNPVSIGECSRYLWDPSYTYYVHKHIFRLFDTFKKASLKTASKLISTFGACPIELSISTFKAN